MLTRTLAARTAGVAVASLLAAVGALATQTVSLAQGGVDCPDGVAPVIDGDQTCIPWARGPIVGDDPVQMGYPQGGAAGSPRCIREHGADPEDEDFPEVGPREIPCSIDDRGRYSRAWDCYLLPFEDLAPEQGMDGYEEHGDDGPVYEASCYPDGSRNPYGLSHWTICACGAQGAEAQWPGSQVQVVIPEAEPLEFDDGGPSLVELWVDAVNELNMRGPAVTTAPPVDTAGLVHLPVWLWTGDTGETWPDELHGDAGAPGIQVDAYAVPQLIEWDMGDGRDPYPCNRPGVAWQSGMDFLDPPAEACTYTYQRSSLNEPGQAFEIVAITTWLVWWEIDGEYDDELEIQVGTTATYQVDEVQVLTSR